jgi:hypothetical protein
MSGTTAIKTENLVNHYAEKLKYCCQQENAHQEQARKAIFETAAIVDEAYRKITQQNDQISLLSRAGMSIPEASKYKTIHKNARRLKPLWRSLPSTRSVLYELSRLTDGQLKRFVADGKLSTEVTAKEIQDYSLGAGLGAGDEVAAGDGLSAEEHGGDEDGRQAGRVGTRPHLIATIKDYGQVDNLKSFKTALDKAVRRVTKGTMVKLEFPESKSVIKDKNRANTAAELTKTLSERLKAHQAARLKLSNADYETIENADWQHQQKLKTGKYPYPKGNAKSVEHPKHPYSISQAAFSTPPKFLRWLQKEKIITPYHPITDNCELREEGCIQLGIKYCEAKNAKARRKAGEALSAIAKSKSAKGRFAKTYQKLLEERGTL